MKTTCIVLLSLLSASSITHAQQPTGTWRHFINATTPRAMVADGPYLWVATDAGLLKFDRTKDTILALYTTDNSEIPANDVWKLAVDKNDTLWVSTRSGGLAKFKNGNWSTFNSSNSPLPGTDGGILAVDSLNRLWVATSNGLLKYDKGAWTKYDSLNAPLASNSVEALAADRKGNIWVGTYYNYFKPPPITRGYILKFDGTSKWEVHNDTLDGHWMYDTTYDTSTHTIKKIDTTLVHELDADNPWCMTVDHTGALWVGFPYFVNRQIPGKGWELYSDIATNNVTFDLEEDTAGIMWGGDAYGIIWIDSVLHKQQRRPFFGDCSIIPIGDSLWIAGNGGGGIAYGKDTAWTIYNNFSGCPFENDEPMAMTIDSKGRYWFGMRPYPMLYMYDGKNWTNYDSLGGGTTGILALAADSSGNVWIGNSNGLVKFDGTHSERIDMHKIDTFSNMIYSIMWDERHQELWVGNGFEGNTGDHSGIARFDGKAWKTWTYPDVFAQILSFAEDTGGHIWATSYDEGVYEQLADASWQLSTLPKTTSPNIPLVADAKGGVWTATDLGPAYWDGSTWQTFSSANIDACTIDPKGKVWFGSYGSAASVFDGSNWWDFTQSNSKIGSAEIWSAMADRNGNIWFGTNGQGLVEFIPDAPATVAGLNSESVEALAAYPNPASASVTLHYSLAEQSAVSITIYDALGRVVARPVVGEMESGGEHEASFDTNSLQPGLYSCRLQLAGGAEMVAKMVVMR